MKIAVVSPIPLHPCNAGNRARTLSLVRALRDLGHDVHFFYLEVWNWELIDEAATASEFAPGRFHRLCGGCPALDNLFSRSWRQLGAKLRAPAAYQYGLDSWFDPRFASTLAAADDAERFDAVMVEYVFLSKAFYSFNPRALRLLDTHDAFADRWKELKKAGIRPYWFSTSPQSEVRGFNRADVVIGIQDEESARFRARIGDAGTPVATVSHLLDLETKPNLAHRPAAGFLASGNHLNKRALRWLTDYILPAVLLRVPSFRLILAGDICDYAPDHPAIMKLGFVSQPSRLFDVASISVNPVQNGTGINIKALDALAAGAPAVSTKTGVRGFQGHDYGGVRVVADGDSSAFADELVKLVEDKSHWEIEHQAAMASARRWNEMQLRALADALASRPGRLFKESGEWASSAKT